MRRALDRGLLFGPTQRGFVSDKGLRTDNGGVGSEQDDDVGGEDATGFLKAFLAGGGI